MKGSASSHGDGVYWEAPLPAQGMEITDFPALSAALILSLVLLLILLATRPPGSAAIKKSAHPFSFTKNYMNHSYGEAPLYLEPEIFACYFAM
jgi:hypothetical protein